MFQAKSSCQFFRSQISMQFSSLSMRAIVLTTLLAWLLVREWRDKAEQKHCARATSFNNTDWNYERIRSMKLPESSQIRPVIIATSRKPTLLVSYLESYLSNLQWWLTEWRIAINVSKSSANIFSRAGRRFVQSRPVTLFGEPIKWVDTTRYLGGDPRQTTHLVASHRSGQQENCSKGGLAGSSPEQEEWSLHQERSPALQAAHPPNDGLRVPCLEVRCPHARRKAAGATIQVPSSCYGSPLVP